MLTLQEPSPAYGAKESQNKQKTLYKDNGQPSKLPTLMKTYKIEIIQIQRQSLMPGKTQKRLTYHSEKKTQKALFLKNDGSTRKFKKQ